MIEREPIYKALYAMVTPLQAKNQGALTKAQPFVTVTRKVIETQRVPPGEQPILMQYEMQEENEYQGRLMTKKSWTVIYIIGVTHEPDEFGAAMLNPLVDMVENVFTPQDGEPITLGGLVENVQLVGIAGKDHGDNSTKENARQAAYYLPVAIYLPG
jgi:hypothetical protein